MKGCQGEREIARKKEMKRRRERGTGAVDSRNRQWQESCSKDMSWFKVDIPHMGKPAHLFQSLLSFLGLHPKGVHYNPCSILEDRFERLGMEPTSSPMAWVGNQDKRYSIVSFRGKASSHGKGCSCVVLPPSAMVFMFRFCGVWVFFNPIFYFQMRL